MSDRVTYMHSAQLGAPQMNGAAGSNGQMLQVLDACLIDGFNPQTVTIATKTATTVILTFGVSHGYVERQLLLVSGATDAALNGKHRVIAATTNTVTIDAVGITATTGAITTKIAPLGFESIFGSADPLKRAYRSQNTQTTQTVLYLDMTIPASSGYHATNPLKRAMVSLCEDMTTLGVQINSYTDAKNNYATNSNGSLLWYQARADTDVTAVTSAKNKSWVIVGNSDYFYLLTDWQTYNNAWLPLRDLFGFGDYSSFGDTKNCFWMGVIGSNNKSDVLLSANGARVNGDPNLVSYKTAANGAVGFIIRPSSGIGVLKPISTLLNIVSGGRINVYSGISIDTSLSYPAYPNPSGQIAFTLPMYFSSRDVTGNIVNIEGVVDSIQCVPHDLKSITELDLAFVDNLLFVAVASSGVYVNTIGYYAIKLE